MRGSLPLPAALLAAGVSFPFVLRGDVVARVGLLGKEFLLHDSSLYHYAMKMGNGEAV